MHHASRTADENLSVQNRRLRERRDIAFKSERPFQLETPHLVDRKPSRVRSLVARVGKPRAPAIPREFRTIRDSDLPVAAESYRRRRRFLTRGSQITRHRLALFPVHRVGDAHHRSKIERAKDAPCCHLLQRLAMRDPWI